MFQTLPQWDLCARTAPFHHRHPLCTCTACLCLPQAAAFFREVAIFSVTRGPGRPGIPSQAIEHRMTKNPGKLPLGRVWHLTGSWPLINVSTRSRGIVAAEQPAFPPPLAVASAQVARRSCAPPAACSLENPPFPGYRLPAGCVSARCHPV